MIDLEKFNFNPEDVILVRYPYEGMDILDIIDIFDAIKQTFPNNTVAAVPTNSTLEAISQEAYEDMMSHLRSGNWIDKDYSFFGYCGATCSKCGHQISVKDIDTSSGHDYALPKYCENCGSRNS